MSFHGISVGNINKIYNNTLILHNLSFKIPAGETLSIIGPSGCGKTTLLYILSGLEKATSGDVSLYSKKIAFILQDYGLFPWKTVEENILLPLLLQSTPITEQKKALKEILEELQLVGLEKRYPVQLSGGQRQRIAIGRALVTKPDILFMDEPFCSLDAITRERLQNTLLQIWQHRKITFVLVTHDIIEATVLGKYIMALTPTPSPSMHWIENSTFSTEYCRSHETFFKITSKLQQLLIPTPSSNKENI